jgi:hypothetical protein
VVSTWQIYFLNNGCNVTDINVKSSLGLTKHHVLTAYERAEVWFQTSLSSALDGKVVVRTLATLSPGKSPMVTTEQEAGWAPQPVWMVFLPSTLY